MCEKIYINIFFFIYIFIGNSREPVEQYYIL